MCASVAGRLAGRIGAGRCAFVAVARGDGDAEADGLAVRLCELRVCGGDDGRMERSVQDSGGGIRIVSNFTVAGRTAEGSRPAFSRAAVGIAAALLAFAVPRPLAAAAHEGGDWGQNRAMGGAGVAVVADSSAIEVNPAGMTQFRRYTLGGMYAHATTGWLMGVALADSKTSPLAMGIDYRHQRSFAGDEFIYGDRRRHDLTVALGEYYLQRANFGLGYTWTKFSPPGTAPTETRHNVHAGLIVPVHRMLRLGAAFYEFVPFDDDRRDPRGDVGLALAPHRTIVLTADGIWHWSQGAEVWELVAGVELIALDQLGIRGGFRYDFALDRRLYSAGLGWFFPRGQLAYAFNTEPGDRRYRHSVSFELYIM